MDIILTIGHEDPFMQNNKQLSSILHQKGINHQLIAGMAGRTIPVTGDEWQRFIFDFEK